LEIQKVLRDDPESKKREAVIVWEKGGEYRWGLGGKPNLGFPVENLKSSLTNGC
jgi:hypothetical protein